MYQINFRLQQCLVFLHFPRIMLLILDLIIGAERSLSKEYFSCAVFISDAEGFFFPLYDDQIQP